MSQGQKRGGEDLVFGEVSQLLEGGQRQRNRRTKDGPLWTARWTNIRLS
jgi:hypothetical protein